MYSQQDNYKDATHCWATIRLQILSRDHFLPSLPSTQIQGRDRCWSWNHGFESKLWNGHCQKRTIMRQEEFILIIIMDKCLSVNCIWKRERKHCCGQLYLWVCRFVFEKKTVYLSLQAAALPWLPTVTARSYSAWHSIMFSIFLDSFIFNELISIGAQICSLFRSRDNQTFADPGNDLSLLWNGERKMLSSAVNWGNIS